MNMKRNMCGVVCARYNRATLPVVSRKQAVLFAAIFFNHAAACPSDFGLALPVLICSHTAPSAAATAWVPCKFFAA